MLEAGLISTSRINKIELTLTRNFLKVQNDVNNELIQKLYGWNKLRSSDVIQSIIANRALSQLKLNISPTVFDYVPSLAIDINNPNLVQMLLEDSPHPQQKHNSNSFHLASKEASDMTCPP